MGSYTWATEGKASPESAFYRFEFHKRKESLSESGTMGSMVSALGSEKKKGGCFDYRRNFQYESQKKIKC